MTGALVILAFTALVGLLLWLNDKRTRSKEPEPVPEEKTDEVAEGECCGMHITCEKDTLTPFSTEIEYYDDEELDRYRGRKPEEYTAEEADEFRDVLLTLLPQDIAGWARSIQLRGIELPSDVRDELLMIVAEQRARAVKQP